MNNKTEDIAISDLAKTLASIDQSAQFELAYNYITNIKKKERKGRNEPINIKDNTVTIGDLMGHFVKEAAETELKFALGWSTIALLKQRQHNLELSDEVTSKIIEKIISPE